MWTSTQKCLSFLGDHFLSIANAHIASGHLEKFAFKQWVEQCSQVKITYVKFVVIACRFEVNRLSCILEMILGNTWCLTKLMLIKLQFPVSIPSKPFGTQPITRSSSVSHTRGLTKLMLMKFQCSVSTPSKTFGTQPITRVSSVSHTRGRPITLVRRNFGYASHGTTLA